jgi:hypothetical protein
MVTGFGYWLKHFRQKYTKLSLRAFSKSIGMDSGNYCKIETDKVIAGEYAISRISATLKLNEVELELLRTKNQLAKLRRNINSILGP